MSFESNRGENGGAQQQSLDLDEQYYAEIKEFDLLTREEVEDLSIRRMEGDRAHMGLIDRIRPQILGNISQPDVQAFLIQIKEMLPANFANAVTATGYVELGIDAASPLKSDSDILNFAFNITKQKLEVQNILYSSRISDLLEGTFDPNDVAILMLKIISIVESKCIPLGKQFAEPRLLELIETKEPVIHFGNEARTKMLQANLRLVLHWAKKYRGRGVEFSDLVEEGNFGLMRAVEYFDHTKGHKFSTYASWWIKQSIDRSVKNNKQDVRLPVHLIELVQGFRYKVSALELTEGRPISEEEGIEMLGYDDTTAASIRKGLQASGLLSLSHGYKNADPGDAVLGQLVEDRRSPRPDDHLAEVEKEKMRSNVFEFLRSTILSLEIQQKLSSREAQILRLRIGMEGEGHMTLEDIGKQFDVTRERIRQIEYIAKNILKTKIAITLSTRQGVRDGTAEEWHEFLETYELIRVQLGFEKKYVRSNTQGLTDKADKIRVEELLSLACNPQGQQVMRLLLGLDGTVLSVDEAARRLSTHVLHLRAIRSSAMDWMEAAVKDPRGIGEVPQEEISAFSTEQGAYDYADLLKKIKEMLSEEDDEEDVPVKKRERFRQKEKCTYFSGKDGILNVEPMCITSTAEKKPTEDSARQAFENLFSDEKTVLKNAQRNRAFPSWMQELNEATLTRLHSLLMQNPSISAIRNFFIKTGTSLVSDENAFEKVLLDCSFHAERTQDLLRGWIKEQDLLPHYSGAHITDKSFIRAAENEKIIAPNLRAIIESHFERHPLPISERVLIDVSADRHMASSLTHLFGKVITIDSDATRMAELDKRSEKFVNIRQSLQEVFLTPEFHRMNGDVVLLGNALMHLPYEEDERAMIWAQSALKQNGISIAILKDRVLEPGSRAHLRKKMGIIEKQSNPARYRDFLAERGFRMEAAQATLHIRSETDKGMEATEDIARFMVPELKRSGLPALQAYMQRHVKGRGKNGENLLKSTLFFLVGHESQSADLTMPRSELPPESIKKEDHSLMEKIIAERSELSQNSLLQSSEEDRGLNRVNDASKVTLNGAPSEHNRGREILSPSKRSGYPDRSYAREEITSGKEFQRVRGKLLRLLHGKHFGKTEDNRPLSAKSKRQWLRMDNRSYNPKMEGRWKERIDGMDARLIQLQRDRLHTVNAKTGEIEIAGRICVQLEHFARLHNLEVNTLKETIHALRIQPASWALRMDSEERALDMGYQTRVYDLEQIKQIPYVRKTLEKDQEFFVESFSAPNQEIEAEELSTKSVIHEASAPDYNEGSSSGAFGEQQSNEDATSLTSL